MTTRFDDSLPLLVEWAAQEFGGKALADAAIVRDAVGQLSLILPIALTPKRIAAAEAAMRAKLGVYARPAQAIGALDDPGAARLLSEARTTHPISVGKFQIRLLDRRIVGADWLRAPAASATKIPRIVFASLKGGVGRSTALCVLAAHFSRRGRRVLAVDFDLEAPGIGTMLLDESALPPFGTLDYLVENGLSGIDDSFMADLSGDSYLGADGARVTIVPAIGKRTIDNPRDTLAKISRAYLEDPKSDAPPVSLSEQFREMIARFEATSAYDVVLVDARAGLHETTAAAILGLGGDVLLFGLDQPQTFLGYKLLMAHLSRFPTSASDDWRDRLTFVVAKASENKKLRAESMERFLSLYEIASAPNADTTFEPEPLTAKDFEVKWDDKAETAIELDEFTPPAPLHILDDSRYRDFNPLLDRELLVSQTYSAAFEALLDYADSFFLDDEAPQQ